jgi:tetratricopeptide (TPR) repeat protein
MTRRRIGLLLIGCILAIGLSYFAVTLISSGQARQPVRGIGFSDSANPGPSTRTLDDIETTIRFWQRRASDNPNDLIAFTLLGESFILKARHTGDVANYQLAEAALRAAVDLLPAYKPANSYLATALFAQHNFQAAIEVAEALYAGDPNEVQALATLGDAHLALGRYAEGEADYQKLLELSPSPPVYSRLAYVHYLRGRSDEAVRMMQKAVDEANRAGGYQEELAWYSYQLGDLYFNMGQIELAEPHYAYALSVFPNYYLGLAGLGKVRAAQGDYDAAIERYRRAIGIVPQPDLLAALGDVYAVAGRPDEARLQYDTVAYIGKLAEITQQVYNRQLANFYSDHDVHLAEALTLATTELESRRDILGYDAAAWAYYKNGLLDPAQAMIEEAMKLGTRDARLFYHAGMIARAQGRTAEAQRLLSEALAINPYFDVLQASVARDALSELLAASD